MEVYFDNAATTKILDEIKEELIDIYNKYGNPSSLHKLGRDSRYNIEAFRKKIAKTFNVDEKDLIYTSSATEANNLIIKGIAKKFLKGHIITSKVEHKSILRVCEYLESKGYEVTYLNVSEDGNIDIEELKSNIKENTFLVSIMAVNNETGVKNPIKEIGNILKDKKIYFHSDIVQYALKEKIDVEKLNLDAFSLSFHKLHGPKGIGLAYINSKVPFEKSMHGGFQERNKRAGTENLTSIVIASKIYLNLYDNLEKDNEYIKKLNMYFLDKLKEFGDKIRINGKNRVNNILNIEIKDKNIEYLLPLFDLNGIYLSGGSACQSGALSPSHVLISMGLSDKRANSCIRISLSRYNNFEEIDYFIETLKNIL